MTIRTATTEDLASQAGGLTDRREFPVREYIGAMAVELAQMARWDGDEILGRLLDAVAARAEEIPPAPLAAADPSLTRRSSRS